MSEAPVEVAIPADPPVRLPVKLKAGELTTEYAQAQNSSTWSKVLIVLGILTNIGGIVMQSMQSFQTTNPDMATSKSFVIAMLVVGTLLAVAGALQKALTDSAYIQGRSLVKAAAARDATPPPEV